MEYGQLYRNERAENLRSKIMILKSSIELLELNFKSTYKKYLSRELVPPFLFPKMTFRRLKSRISDLQNLIESTVTELPIGFLEATFLSVIDTRLDRIMDSAIKLQELLIQRTAGIEAFDNIDYHVNFQIEYSGLTKVFNAVDALVYELVERSMSIKWIQENEYVPITVFGKRNFSINPETFVIYLPYYDCFRSKSWSALAHEVAHVFFRVHFERRYETGFWEFESETQEEENFQISVLAAIKDLHELCFAPGSFDYENPTDTTYQIVGQINELVCDTLSTYLCGPASLLTFSEIVNLLLPRQQGLLEEWVAFDFFHPPFDVRVLASSASLKFTNILSRDKNLKELIDVIVEQCRIKNENLIELGWIQPIDRVFLEKYMSFARQFAWDLLDSFSQMNIRFFSEEEWLKVNENLEKGKFDELTPVQFSNLVWLKRLSVVADEDHIDFLEYGKNRSVERKIFEHMVNCGYKYYEKILKGDV